MATPFCGYVRGGVVGGICTREPGHAGEHSWGAAAAAHPITIGGVSEPKRTVTAGGPVSEGELVTMNAGGNVALPAPKLESWRVEAEGDGDVRVIMANGEAVLRYKASEHSYAVALISEVKRLRCLLAQRPEPDARTQVVCDHGYDD